MTTIVNGAYPVEGSAGRVYYDQTFSAPCSNDVWDDETGARRDCPGMVTFGPQDSQAACGACGAWCGRLVAFGLPSGASFRDQAWNEHEQRWDYVSGFSDLAQDLSRPGQ